MGGDDELIEYEWARDTGKAVLTYEKEDGTTYQVYREQTTWWCPELKKGVASGNDA